MKKPIGSQYSFANLDGARASIDSVDRLSISERQEEVEADEEVGTVSSPAASPESRVNDHTVIWTVDGRCILVPVTEVTEYPGATRWPKEWEDEEEKAKEEKEEENETTDSTFMLESSRNPTVPCTSEVATEPTNENRCYRPLQRARERRATRLQKESDAHAVTNLDPNDSGSQRSSVSCDLEQDGPQLQCSACNNILTESDLSAWDDLYQSLKSEGRQLVWDGEIENAPTPACAACTNHWSL